MGDPGKTRKKYDTPIHPWQRARITEERRLSGAFGLKSKAEIWKMHSTLKSYTRQAMRLVTVTGAQADLERKQLIEKLGKLGLMPANSKVEDVLRLTINDVMERRLQTLLFRKGLARSPIQARQFITHGHVTIKGNKITSPSYLVPVSDEASIGFHESSSLNSVEHPERTELKSKPKSTAKVENESKK